MTMETQVDLPTAFAAAAGLAADGATEAAVEAFEAVIARWPSVVVAHANLAVLLRRVGRVDDSIAAFQTAARLDPSDPARHFALATACHAAGRMEMVAESLRRLSVLRPANPEAAYNLGITLPLLGTRADGRRWLARAVVLDPMRPGAWGRLARVTARLGERERAGTLLRRARILAPADIEVTIDCARLLESAAASRQWMCLAPDDDDAAITLAELRVTADDPEGVAWALQRFAGRPEVPDAALRAGRRAGLQWARIGRSPYERWLDAYDRDDPAARASEAAAWSAHPTFSVILPVCDPPPEILQSAIGSVEQQIYPHWQLRIADDASRDPAVRAVLVAASQRDPRITVTWRDERGHISAATNSALEGATGDWVTFLDHDDRLHVDALRHVAASIVDDESVDLIFTDEDKIDELGSRFDPHFKPDWDPDRILGQNYVCHLAVYRRALVEAVGGLRVGLEGSQDHDLVLRIAEQTTPARIRHLPRALYHWRTLVGSTARGMEAKPYAVAATRRAVSEHLARSGSGARLIEAGNDYRVLWPLPDPPPLASVIVATRDRVELLSRCVDGVLNATDYPHREVILLDNGSEQPQTHAWLARIAEDPRVRVLRRPGPFNFSALMNDGAAAARGEVLIFLNNDVEPLGAGWLDEMVRQACRPDVGAVGAKLLYPDRKVQHGGVILAGHWVARHADVGHADSDSGYMGRSRLVQSMSAVTGACLGIRRSVFESIGGFDAEHLAVDYSDIDLCLKAGAAGWRTVWTPYARLLHHESASRGPYITVEKRVRWEAESDVMRARWGERLNHDPWYNPNLAILGDQPVFSLAFPPRPPLGKP